MNEAVKKLGQVQLGTSLTTIYTCPSQPAGIKARVSCLCICNTDGSAHTVTIREGIGSLTAANSLLESAAIDANKTYFLSENQGFDMVIEAGGKLQGLADAGAKITVSAYGEEILG